MSDESVPLTNGHDKNEDVTPDPLEAAHGAIVLKQHITELQVTASRQAERATIEALVQDAMRRYVEAMKAGNHRAAIEATRARALPQSARFCLRDRERQRDAASTLRVPASQ